MNRLSLLIICLAITSFTAVAQSRVKPNPQGELEIFFADVPPTKNFKFIGETNLMRRYYDSSNFKFIGKNIIRTWVGQWPSSDGVKDARWRQKIIDDIEEAGGNARGYESYERTLELIECNCDEDKFRILKRIDYDSDGEVITSEDHLSASWMFATPGSIGFTMVKKICAAKLNRKTLPSQSNTPRKRRT